MYKNYIGHRPELHIIIASSRWESARVSRPPEIQINAEDPKTSLVVRQLSLARKNDHLSIRNLSNGSASVCHVWMPSSQNKEYIIQINESRHTRSPLNLPDFHHVRWPFLPRGSPRVVQKRFDYTHAYNALNIIKTCILLLFILRVLCFNRLRRRSRVYGICVYIPRPAMKRYYLLYIFL